MSDLLERARNFDCREYDASAILCELAEENERLQEVVDAALAAVDAYFAIGDTHGERLEKMQYLANALAPFRALDGEVGP